MKVNRNTLIGFLFVLVPSFAMAAPELEEIMIYDMITLTPNEVSQSIQDEETDVEIKLYAKKDKQSDTLETLNIKYGEEGSISTPRRITGCVPSPQLALIRIVTTSNPMLEDQFKSRSFSIYVPFSGHWTRDRNSKFIQPELVLDYYGAKLTRIIVQNGKGDFVEVEQPGETCPMQEIEWAREGADQ